MRHSIGVWTLAVFVCACVEHDTEIHTLYRVDAPDHRHSAQLDHITGGPPIGGAVLWQELHVLTPDARNYRGPGDTMLALTCNDESTSPCVSVQWESPTRLWVTLRSARSMKTSHTSVDGVEIFYVDGTAGKIDQASVTP